jgi:hypothetical protein
MVERAMGIGEHFGVSKYAEGWTRHNYTGYSSAGFHPLQDLLAEYISQCG